MADRKYQFRDGVLWHREGNYPVPADEPLCTLRGKDPDSLAAIRAYIQRCEEEYQRTGDENARAHADGARETLAEFVAFQRANPSRVKRGCHNCG
jgi:hypothetical protein